MIGKTNSQTGGTLKGEKLNISLFTNQSSHADVLGAIVTVTNPAGATQHVWEGHEITVAVFPGVEYEVSVSDVDGYKTPDKFTATSVADNARTISFEYKAEKVKVNISASNGMDMTGTNVSINGKGYTYQGSAIEALVPFGTEYSVQAASVGSLVTPPVQFFTASIPLREINLEYRTSILVVKMLSNQGNDTTIANLKASVELTDGVIEVGNGQMVDIPSGESITITFPEVENYNTPAPITFTTNTGLNERSVTYSTELVIVNASANDGNSVDGVTATVNRYKKQPYTPANGVYIQDVDGFLYTTSEWDGSKTPNGIAVVSDTCQFVIALSDVGSKSWGPNQNISNIVSTDNEWTAKADYSGDANTTQIVSQIGADADYAAQACRKFTFPNGKAGYLPAAGELALACTWRSDINAAFSKCGGTAFIDEYYWSSTQYSIWNAWLVLGNSGSTRGDFGKNYFKQVRPFANLEAKIIQQYDPEEKIITNGKAQFKVSHGTEYDVTMSDKQGYKTPAMQSFVANSTSRSVPMVYELSGLKLNILSNQPNDTTIADVKALVTYGSNSVELGNGEILSLSASTEVTITFPDVPDYKTPEPITFTHTGGLSEKTGTYLTEKVTVNVSANDGTSVEGQVVTVAKTIPNGVYIQDIKGNLYKESDWDDSKAVNGIAVVTDECQFVMALSDALASTTYWGGYGTKVTGIATTTDQGTALADYAGDTNTTQIINQLQGKSDSSTTGAPAAEACRAFIFPNGKAGYLPALGELYAAYANKSAIATALGKCRGTALIEDYYWSSTQYDGNYSWRMGWNDGNSNGTYKTFGAVGRHAVRAFTTLESIINETYEVTDSPITFKAAHGTEYSVSVNDKEGYQTPATKSFTAQLTVNNVAMEYVKSVSKRTVIRIDQTLTDPEAMITRIVDEGGIEDIRANSHRYTGTFANGVMTLKQLDDTDGTKYADGTTATLTTIGTDVWMKLPQFHWKCSQYATDVWDFEVVYGAKPDDTYKTWDGNDLIGAYEAYNSSNKSYSVSGKDSTGNVYQDKFKTYAQARGEGFSLVKWKHHCMMAMLYYTMYGNTNCQAKIGKGTDSTTKATGATNSLGMTDTVAGGNGDSNSINFWGLENWWGNKDEWVDNVAIDVRVWKVTEDDGTVRQAGTGGSSNGWISKLLLGENIDLIPTAASGSETTGYCDYYAQSSANTRVFVRASYSANTYGGVACATATQAYLMSSDSRGSRLAFRGNIVIE